MRWPDLRTRSEAHERMDDRTIVGPELDEALQQLRLINRLLGSVWPTLEGVARLWRNGGRPRDLLLVDVGAGSGDVNRLLLRWARWRGIRLRIVLVDIHAQTCAVAAAYYRTEPRVNVICADLHGLPVQQVDLVTASFLLHHMPDRELVSLVVAMRRMARLGVVINDLHRHPVAYGAIALLTRVFSRNPMIRNDAPLSVWRGFRGADLARLRAADPLLADLRYGWRPWFRYLVTIPGAEAQHD